MRMRRLPRVYDNRLKRFDLPRDSLGAVPLDIVGAATSATQMATEAKPRVDRALAQYDRAAPAIDWMLDNWILVGIGAFAAGVAAGYVANALYHRKG